MFDAIKILGAMMEQRAAPSARARLGAAGQQGGLLQDILSQLGGAGMGQGGVSDILANVAGMAKRAMETSRQEVSQNNPAAVGGLGALAGAILGGGKGAVGGGLMAVLGSLAYSAMQAQGAVRAAGSGQAPGTGQAAGGTGGGAHPSTPVADAAAGAAHAEAQRKATLLLRAMIAAAKADGQIDTAEMNRIVGKLHAAGDEPEARDFVLKEMSAPLDLDALVKGVASQQEGVEVYAASLLAIEVDTPAEKEYMARLATALNLPQPLVEHVHGAVGMKPAAM